MGPDDKVVILCKRTSEIDNPGPEATTGNCWKCGVEVWVGPNSRRRMREFRANLYCTPCGLTIMNGETSAIIGTAGQIESLNEDVEKLGGTIFPLTRIDGDPDQYLRERK